MVALAGIALCVASTLLKTHQLLLFYPLVVNAVMLAAFGGSLWTTMPLVERPPAYESLTSPPPPCAIPVGSRRSGACFYRQWQYRPLDGAVR